MGIRTLTDAMRAVERLLVAAEAEAAADGAAETAAEHIVLAALAEPGGSAARAVAGAGLDPAGYRAALAAEQADALHAVGVAAARRPPGAPAAIAAGRGRHRMSPSGRRLFHRVAGNRVGAGRAPEALGAQVVLALAETDGGLAVRALARMGGDPAAVARAAREEIAAAG